MSEQSSRDIYFKIPNIMCSGCAQTIKAILNSSEKLKKLGLIEVLVNWPQKEGWVRVPSTVTHTNTQIHALIQSELKDNAFKLETTPLYSYLIKGIIGSLLGLVLLIIMACGFTIPLVAMGLIASLASLLTLYLGFDTYKSALIQLIKTKKLTMDALFAVSTLTAIGVSIAAFFVPWLPMMFDVALLIFGFKHIGTAIEEAATRKIMKGIAFRDRIPKSIESEEKNADGIILKKRVLVDELKLDQIIIVPGGEIIPVDGECVDSESCVYETIYNGNPTSTKIKKGHLLLGGMRVGENVSYMRVRVTAVAENSYPMRVDRFIDNAQIKNAPVENIANKISRYFVPAIFGFALISAIIIGCFFPPAIAIQCAIATLVSACPCTLGFIIPLTVNIGISKGRKYGVQFKGGEALQLAAEADTIAFDLNGTLTTGEKTVSGIVLKDKTITEMQIADYLYLLERESKSKHPIAKAIESYADKYKSENISTYHLKPDGQENNSGVRCEINGEWYTLGNHTMMTQHQINVSEDDATISQAATDQVVYLARGKEIIAVVNITDPIRKDAPAVINQLPRAGYKVYLITGTDFNTAKFYINKYKLDIPIENIRSNCIPLTKTSVIQELEKQYYDLNLMTGPKRYHGKIYIKDTQKGLQYEVVDFNNKLKTSIIPWNKLPAGFPSNSLDIIQAKEKFLPFLLDYLSKSGHIKKHRGKVAFVGDGGNDALAMTMNKCFGIVMKSSISDKLTEDSAKAMIEGRSLQPILSTFNVAKETIHNIKLSLGISLAYNMATLLIAGGLLVAVGFTLNPAIGVALMIAQACFILAMAYYFKRKTLPKFLECSQIPAAENKNTSSTNKLTKFFRIKPANDLVVIPNQQDHVQSSPPLTRLSAMFLNLFRKNPANECKNTCSTIVPETRYSL